MPVRPLIRPRLIAQALAATSFLAAGPVLAADDPTDQTGTGYKTVEVKTGNGQNMPIRVVEQPDPFRHLSSTSNSGAKYNPERIFSATSSMANKKFSATSFGLPDDSNFSRHDQNTFPTHSYNATPESQADPSSQSFHTKSFPVSSARASSATGADASFVTAKADLGQAQAVLPPSRTTVDDQNRAAVLGGEKITETPVDQSVQDKQYLGPGAQRVPPGLDIKDNMILSRVSNVPNRPLTIDEVRDLINHGTKPDTGVAPEPPSKPLNDPNYQPEPLRDDPSPSPSTKNANGASDDDDKDDPVPPPGTMAQHTAPPPENSEPLPQR